MFPVLTGIEPGASVLGVGGLADVALAIFAVVSLQALLKPEIVAL